MSGPGIPREAIEAAARAVREELADYPDARQQAWNIAAAALRGIMPLIGGDDHFATFTRDQWTVEHPLACRLSGRMTDDCDYHAAVARDPDDARARSGYGRFLLAVDEDGWPELEEVTG